MEQEQDNYCYLFTLASTNKATLQRWTWIWIQILRICSFFMDLDFIISD